MKKYLMGLGALALAFMLNSFTAEKPEVNTAKQESLFWYVRNSANNYTQVGTSPSTTPPSQCPNTGSTICAMGFSAQQNASQLDDSSADDAQSVVFRN